MMNRHDFRARWTTRTQLFALGAVLSVLAVGLAAGPGDGPKPATSAACTAVPLAARVQHFDQMPADKTAWGSLRWLMNAKIDPQAGLTLGIAETAPGKSNPLHVHANCEEVIYMISGSCEQRVGNETVILRPGDTLRIPAGVPHCAKALGNEPTRAVVVYNTGTRQFAVVEAK